MTDIPVLFQPDLVDAIDQDRKTMTRRYAWGERFYKRDAKIPCGLGAMPVKDGFMVKTRSVWQNVKAGDRLWVREQHWRWGTWEKNFLLEWSFHPEPATMGNIFFGKQPAGQLGKRVEGPAAWHKRPSIFMPKQHSRFTLIVTATKVEPVQAISEADARAEGVSPKHAGVDADCNPIKTYRTGFIHTWRHINGDDSWAANPEVVAVTFRVIKANIEQLKEAA
jgi:hypothetical protein